MLTKPLEQIFPRYECLLIEFFSKTLVLDDAVEFGKAEHIRVMATDFCCDQFEPMLPLEPAVIDVRETEWALISHFLR